MPDSLDTMETCDLRKECLRRGIHFPCGHPVLLSTKRECITALRNPAYAEALNLGLIGSEEE